MQSTHTEQHAKKSYQSPLITVYGDIREITQGTGTNHPDNPGTGKS